MIKAKNIHKYYDDLHVLKGVDVHIKKGEIVSIVGASGAGKTTLLQILGTLDFIENKTESQLIINGKEITGLTEKQLAQFRNQNIGFIFQFHQLLPEFTAIENVCIPAFIKGTNTSDAEKRAKELLDFLGLSHRYNHKPSELSGGEQQRVAIARSYVNDPKIILADEPTANLDKELSLNFINILKELKSLNKTIIIATHDPLFFGLDFIDREIEISNGLIVE